MVKSTALMHHHYTVNVVLRGSSCWIVRENSKWMILDASPSFYVSGIFRPFSLSGVVSECGRVLLLGCLSFVEVLPISIR